MIIDIHTHLGDILYPHGGDLILKKNVSKKFCIDLVTISELGSHHTVAGLENFIHKQFMSLIVRAQRRRNFIASLENMDKSMRRAGVTYSVCMPIAPYLTFDDLKKASVKDPRLIPFTSVDFTQPQNIVEALTKNIENGAKGLKLHPIIQNEPLDSEKTFNAVEVFSAHHLPVLFHCGVSSYYLGKEKQKENPQYGQISYAKTLVDRFPDVNFIAGHAGLFEVDEVIKQLGPYPNVWVDISFQPPEKVGDLIFAFGPEKVLYGSDWPFGNMMPAIKIVKNACRGDQRLEKMIFYENAANLLGLM